MAHGNFRFVGIAGLVFSSPFVCSAAPVASGPPYSTRVDVGETISLAATADSQPTATYQWYRDGVPIPGATTAAYQKAGAQPGDSGDYFAVTSDATQTTTSEAARVDVIKGREAPWGSWWDVARNSQVAYFLSGDPARIDRYDLIAEAWLGPITLTRSGRVLLATDSYLYVGAGRAVYRYSLDGTGEALFCQGFKYDVVGLVFYKDYLVVTDAYPGSDVTVFRLADGTIASTQSYNSDWSRSVVTVPSRGELYSMTYTQQWQISSTTISDAGVLSGSLRTSTNWNEPNPGYRLFVTPGEHYIIHDRGTVYTTGDLTLTASLGGALDDLVFTATGEPVALRAGAMIVFRNDFSEVGRASTGIDARRLFVQGTNAFAFAPPTSGGSISVRKMPLDAVAPRYAPAVDAGTTPFTPDAVLLDRDGNVLLYSRLYGQVFRWSPIQHAYLSPIQLYGWPATIVYSPTNYRLYTAHLDGRLFQVKLDAGSLLEEPFNPTPRFLSALLSIDDLVFVASWSRAPHGYAVFSKEGQLLAEAGDSSTDSAHVWDPIRRRVYAYSTDIVNPGPLDAIGVSPSGILTNTYSQRFGSPDPSVTLFVSPDGNVVIRNSGLAYSAATLRPTESLGNAVEDLVWINNHVFSARTVGTGIEVQRWSGSAYVLAVSTTVPGRLVKLLALPSSQLLVVTMRGNIAYFTILDENLNIVSTDAALRPSHLINVATRGWAGQGDQTMSAGFVVAGNGPKQVLVRCAGPALAAFGVSNTLADPQITVFNGQSVAVASNDNWSEASNAADIATAASRMGAFAFPAGSRDAALLVTLPPGAYSVQATGVGGASGTVLVEVYDTDTSDAGSNLVNMSTRALVGVGDAVLIPGFVIAGALQKTVLIRAVGSGLRPFGVNGVLQNPRLQLYRDNNLIAENDDWDSGNNASAVTAANTKTGAFQLTAGSRDAALLVTLAPGAYSAIATGADGSTGVALVEIYEVPE